MTPVHAVNLGFNASFARLIADHVRAQDLDHRSILGVMGLSEMENDSNPPWVPAQQLCEALRLAATLCADPHIGLSIGQQVRPANLGSLGYTLISAADLQTGLAMFERLQSLICTQMHIEHRIKGHFIDSQLVCSGDVPSDTNLWVFTMVARVAFGRWVTGRHLVPLQLRMPCPPPLDAAPLRAYIGCDITFDAEHAGERVPANWLQLPNPHADAKLHTLMSAVSDQQWAKQGQDQTHMVSVLRGHITTSLQKGRLPLLDKLAPDLEADLGLSARQIQRRLSENGLSFKDMVEAVRREQVLHDLRHSLLPLADIAKRAAYTETSSMNRAVRRWTGLTPTAVRQG